MQAYKYPHKDRLVWVFKLVSEKQADGEVITKRVYFNAKDMPYKAYVRSVSAKERDTDNTVYPLNEIEVVINYRPELRRAQDAYLEFDKGTYAISGIDCLEFRGTEMKLRASSIDLGTYDTAEYRESYV